MKRDDLKTYGLTDEAMDFVMSEFGKVTEASKATQTELAKAKADLEAATQRGANLETIQAELAKTKAELAKSLADAQSSQKQWQVHEGVMKALEGKSFVNDITKDAIAKQMEASVLQAGNAEADYEAVLKSITEGKANVFKDEPLPPVQPQIGATSGQNESGVAAAFKKLNPWHTE